MRVIFVLFWIAAKTAQEGPRGAQEAQGAPQSALRRPKRLPRVPQEAPSGPQEAPRAGQEGSKPAQELPRASQDAHKAFPKHVVRQPFSEKLKKSNYGSKRHRRHLRSPISMNPKVLASNRRLKKGGRAAVIPLGEVNPPPAPEGRSWACQIKSQMPKSTNFKSPILKP